MKVQKGDYEGQIKSLRSRSEEVELDLSTRLRIAEDDLVKLEKYRSSHDQVEKQMNSLNDQLREKEVEMATKLERQERKFYEEKARMQREMNEMAKLVKVEARSEALRSLDKDTKRMVNDNRRMREEIRFQNSASHEIQDEKSLVLFFCFNSN